MVLNMAEISVKITIHERRYIMDLQFRGHMTFSLLQNLANQQLVQACNLISSRPVQEITVRNTLRGSKE